MTITANKAWAFEAEFAEQGSKSKLGLVFVQIFYSTFRAITVFLHIFLNLVRRPDKSKGGNVLLTKVNYQTKQFKNAKLKHKQLKLE